MSKDIRTVTIRPRAKINLSIDVVGKRPDGMHEVDMVMQAIDFRDEVTVSVLADGQREIRITCDRPGVPTDRGNICWKAVDSY